MNRITLSLLVCALLFSSFSTAQQKPHAVFNHPLRSSIDRPFSPQTLTVPVSPETLHVLCAMVEFQEDSDGRTSGNGSFDLSDTSGRILDPPPHTKSYFGQHMTFAQNYFRKVSGGKFIVTGDVLDSTYRLPHNMAYYSPPRNSNNNTVLGHLVEDSWHLIDSLTPGIPFRNYQAFILFHAGVGRDVASDVQELAPTPFDIPSITFTLPSLQQIFGSSYEGVPVAGNSFHITNSMIIPETESRFLPSVIGSYFQQLGINGLIVASIGSYKGLPDLFDTKTGASGIGRFGLMDGQSIFSWDGVFPPEPSAWEKQFLGWIKPVIVSSGDSTYQLPAVSLPNAGDSILKVLISSKEYFLIENRNRDVNRDGSNITTIFNGDTLHKSWLRDTVSFNPYNIDSIYGNVIDVDEFDWSLPGGFDLRNVWYDGGILIWHIDENVIDANYASNTVNADPTHRGVDVEEADGSQDIGHSYDITQPGYGSENGTLYDYWYLGNGAPVRFHANFFTPTSFPNSLSYSGANSHVYVKNFSARGPRMTTEIQVGDTMLTTITGFPKYTGAHAGNHSLKISPYSQGLPGVFLSTDSAIYGWDIIHNQPLFPAGASSGLIVSRTVGCQQGFVGTAALNTFQQDSIPVLVQTENSCAISEVSEGSLLTMWNLKDSNNDGFADRLRRFGVDTLASVTSPALSNTYTAVGLAGNTVAMESYEGVRSELTFAFNPSVSIVGVSLWQQPKTFLVLFSNGALRLVSLDTVLVEKSFSKTLSSPAVTGIISSTIGKHTAFASTDGYVYLLDENLNVVPGFPVSTGGEILNSPALADIDGDGQRDIIVFSGNKIWAINTAGVTLENFPIPVSTQKTILSSPVLADLDGNGFPDVIAVTQEGLVVAYDKSGTMVPGFPLQTGPNSGSTPAVLISVVGCPDCEVYDVTSRLFLASDDGYLYGWQDGTRNILGGSPISLSKEQPWPQYQHDSQNSGMITDSVSGHPRSDQFLPSSLAYNWPNPVGAKDGYKTHIRYFLSQSASVEIKIVDLAGDLVATLNGPGIGGLDNEIEWDVSNIQSGVYFAHIKAANASTTGVAIVKIAVVK